MEDYVIALNDAIRYLKFRIRSETELIVYLKKRGHEEGTISAVVKELKKKRFVDDAAFSKLYVYDALNIHYKGPFRIRIELEKLGVDTAIIDNAIAEVTAENNPVDILRHLVASSPRDALVDKKQKEKLRMKLYRKGFSLENINAVLKDFQDDF